MKTQPTPGDVLLGCIHRPDPYDAHIFNIPEGLKFTKPDKTKGTAEWIILCDACFARYGAQPSHAPISCDCVWKESDKPLKYKESS